MLVPSASLASPTPSVTPTPTFDVFGAALLRPRQTDFYGGCYVCRSVETEQHKLGCPLLTSLSY